MRSGIQPLDLTSDKNWAVGVPLLHNNVTLYIAAGGRH